MGEPLSNINCFRLIPAFSGVLLPIRVPSPAAGMMTETFMKMRFLATARPDRSEPEPRIYIIKDDPFLILIPLRADKRINELVCHTL